MRAGLRGSVPQPLPSPPGQERCQYRPSPCMPLNSSHVTTTADAGQQLPENYSALARELRKFLREDQVVLAVATPLWFRRFSSRPISADSTDASVAKQWWVRRAGE
jgi:hypothetical protein